MRDNGVRDGHLPLEDLVASLDLICACAELGFYLLELNFLEFAELPFKLLLLIHKPLLVVHYGRGQLRLQIFDLLPQFVELSHDFATLRCFSIPCLSCLNQLPVCLFHLDALFPHVLFEVRFAHHSLVEQTLNFLLRSFKPLNLHAGVHHDSFRVLHGLLQPNVGVAKLVHAIPDVGKLPGERSLVLGKLVNLLRKELLLTSEDL
mmetsp:Transcript_20873/g.48379  ORF Transcript_20873/g.48379 Transcript_20873/m.48379 type:complete len:205 (-) Transcript_20873:662-1276(-)